MKAEVFSVLPIRKSVAESNLPCNQDRLKTLINKDSLKYLSIYDFDQKNIKDKLDLIKSQMHFKSKQNSQSKPKFKIKQIIKQSNRVKLSNMDRIMRFFQNKLEKIVKEPQKSSYREKSSNNLSELSKLSFNKSTFKKGASSQRNTSYYKSASTSVSPMTSNTIFLTERCHVSPLGNNSLKFSANQNNLDVISEKVIKTDKNQDFYSKKSRYKELKKTRNLATIKSQTVNEDIRKPVATEENEYENQNYNNIPEFRFSERRDKYLTLVDQMNTISPLDNDKVREQTCLNFIRKQDKNIKLSSKNVPLSRQGSVKDKEKFSAIKSKIFAKAKERNKEKFNGEMAFIKLKNWDIQRSLASNSTVCSRVDYRKQNEHQHMRVDIGPDLSKRKTTQYSSLYSETPLRTEESIVTNKTEIIRRLSLKH